MKAFSRILGGQGLFSRAARGSIWSISGFVASQAVRLVSNLILTRLLFPEAFGLMTLVTVITIGVAMLSEVGIGLSISQSKRGDDPRFLDTAWTIQVIRGVLLAAIVAALGWPAAQVYQEPLLAAFLPVAAIGLLISGFNPMSIETAARHMLLGRVTLIDLLSQVLATIVTILLAWATQSVWSLVWGNVSGSLSKLVLAHLLLRSGRSRFGWEPAATRELIHFGKWIFASTAFGFLLSQGDRMILGRYVSLDLLGIYNVAQFLATAPMLLASNALSRVIIPLYRESIADPSERIKRRLVVLRRAVTAGTLLLEVSVALIAVALVGIMYDERYSAAGPIAVLIALVQLPLIIGMTYDRAALAAGNSRLYFQNVALRTVLQTTLLIFGAQLAGLPGALAGQTLAGILGHVVIVRVARHEGVWDPVHDMALGGLGLLLGCFVLWLNWPAVAALLG